MLSHKYKCIFIHIPKCAGTTVEQYFARPGITGAGAYFCWPVGPTRMKRLARAINLYPDYFTFTFVRNPFDRFISYYLFGLWYAERAGRFAGYKNVRECIELAAELLSMHHKESDREGKIGPHQLRPKSFDYGYARYHCKRQIEFLLDPNPYHYFGVPRFNSDPCSFIGRVESFDKDFTCLLDILDVPSRPVVKHYYVRRKGSQGPHYSLFYDKATRRLVEDLYAPDLEALGYEFEQEGVVSVLSPLYDPEEARRRRRQGTEISRHQWAELFCKRLCAYAKAVPMFAKRFLMMFLVKLKKFLRRRWAGC